ncbi:MULTISPECIES: hypothetical protein [unclassified Rhizobium]|uniref:hypothetical protein n=1 Tax=Rhizobium sp. BG4 TaxID=2613770 RepID=UPI00193DF70D|nr:hypothetical protein [Rhizobium sp. BG4]QRM47479.1 hypothetical protein F2982_29725 [Rhizobium sp. BG4]
MSIVTLLSLDDAKIDVVMNTVCAWCRLQGYDIHSDTGKGALEIAVSMALGDTWDAASFSERFFDRLGARS